MNRKLTPMPQDWKRALAVVAHPDDLEYGAASAIARWSGEGRSVAYLIEPWSGATDVYLMGVDDPTHAVDVTGTLATGVASLPAHRAYLDGLGRDFDPEQFLRGFTAGVGAGLRVPHAVAFGRIQLQGV